MKKVCVKWLALSLAVLLLCGTAVGCNDDKGPSDAERYTQAQAAMEQGDYAQAYLLLRDVKDTAENADAIALRDKLVFVPVKITSQDSDGLSTNTISYDEQGHVTEQTLSLPNGVTGKITYTYDDCGNRLKKEYTRTDKETVASDVREYNEKNQVISQITTQFSGNVSTETFSYDEDGNCILKTLVTSAGANKEYVYQYEGGKVQTEIAYNVSLGQRFKFETTNYTYDSQGNVRSAKHIRGLDVFSSFYYTYDQNNNLELYQELFASGSYYEIKRSYDSFGNELTYRYSSGTYAVGDEFPPTELVFITAAESQYTYDAYGNVATDDYKITQQTGKTIDCNETYEWQLFYYPDGIPVDITYMQNADVRDLNTVLTMV